VKDAGGSLPPQRAQVSDANELVLNLLNRGDKHDLLIFCEVGGGSLPMRFLEKESRCESKIITFHKDCIEQIHLRDSGSLSERCKH